MEKTLFSNRLLNKKAANECMARQGKRVTIYDVAARLNVSPSTISRVLSKADYPVNADLREKVLQAAAEMNYYPNLSARNLKKQQNRQVGLVIPSISNPFYPSIIRGIEDVAYENGYSLFLCSGDRDAERENNYIKLLIENNVAGVITLMTSSMLVGPVAEVMIGYLSQGGVVLAVDVEKSERKDIGVFYFDKQREGRLATQHLLELGHQRMVFVTAPLTNPIRIGKVTGYQDTMAVAGFSAELVVAGREYDLDDRDHVYDCQIGVELARKVLLEKPDVTAILCMNDLMVLGCLAELAAQGKRVPHDYSVIGFDDSFFSELVQPKITTVGTQKYKIGQLAMEKMIEVLEHGGTIKHYDVSSYTQLVVRESTGVPRK